MHLAEVLLMSTLEEEIRGESELTTQLFWANTVIFKNWDIDTQYIWQSIPLFVRVPYYFQIQG